MKKRVVLFILFFMLNNIAFSQSDTLFYKDKYLTDRCEFSEAKYLLIKTKQINGQFIEEVKQLRGNVTLRKELSTGEPIGIWEYDKKRILNFDFTLNYIDTSSGEKVIKIDRPFYNNDKLNYEAPQLDSKEKTVYKFLKRNFIYPQYVIEESVSGEVLVKFKITSEGVIKDIVVLKSVHISLDKEVVRLLRELKFISPPKLDNVPTTIYTTMPFKFWINE